MSRKEMARDLRRRRLTGNIDPEEADLLKEIEIARPKTRADCVNSPRPCNFAGVEFHRRICPRFAGCFPDREGRCAKSISKV